LLRLRKNPDFKAVLERRNWRRPAAVVSARSAEDMRSSAMAR
jgi:hypothetical protein